MDYKAKIKDLRTKTVLMPETFKKFGLEIESVGFSGLEEDGFYVLVEISSNNRSSLKETIKIKVNLYDETGQIIAVEECLIFEDDFDGYDTFSISFDEPDILARVQKIRLYATR